MSRKLLNIFVAGLLAISLMSSFSISRPSDVSIQTTVFNSVYQTPEYPFGHEWDTGDGEQVYDVGWGGDIITVYADVTLDPQAKLYIKYDYCNEMACYDGEPGGWDDMDFRNSTYVLGWEMNYIGGTQYSYTLIGDWALGYPTYTASTYNGIHVGYTVYAKNTTDGSVVVGEPYHDMYPYWPASQINVTSSVSKTVLDPGEDFWVNGSANYWHRLNWHDQPPADLSDVTVSVNPVYQGKTDGVGNFSMTIPAPMAPGFHTVNTTVSNTTENRNATSVSTEIIIEVLKQQTPHLPIRINSNADFDQAHGVTNWATGDGSQGNPWTIEGWIIDGGGFGGCIYIGNVTEHFKIQNCSIFNSSDGMNWPYYMDAGVIIQNTQNGTIINNNVSWNMWTGICVNDSSYNRFLSNNFNGFQSGISINYDSNHNLIQNNSIINGMSGIYLGGYLKSCSYNEIIGNNIISNSNNGIRLYYNCDNNNITGNEITDNGGPGIDLTHSDNNNIIDNIVSSNYMDDGIRLEESHGNNIINNVANDNRYAGIRLSRSADNLVSENHVEDNDIFGIRLYQVSANNNNITHNDIIHNDYGISMQNAVNNNIIDNVIKLNTILGLNLYGPATENNWIYHNDIVDNVGQAYDETGLNYWDNGYPEGGNYWSDYIGPDDFNGPNQNIPGRDGIGDTPYTNIQGAPGVQDDYPWIHEVASPILHFTLGWNLISLPLLEGNVSINDALVDIQGKWNYIMVYDSTSPSPWKTNCTYRPENLNDLKIINNNMGIWINITEPNITLSFQGSLAVSTNITLYSGWNLVGYPTLTNKVTVSSALWGTMADRVEICDPSEPYYLREVGPNYFMKPGEGYWVHVPFDTVWVVDW